RGHPSREDRNGAGAGTKNLPSPYNGAGDGATYTRPIPCPNIYIIHKSNKTLLLRSFLLSHCHPLLSPQFLLRSLLFWSGLLYSLIIQTADLFDLESYPFNLNYSWHFYSELIACELIACDLGSGSMEFVVPPADPASFFPISVRFTAASTFSDLKVANILPLGGGPAPKFSQRTC
ncbi:unnamed protein product, partial [Coffea canephora]